MATGICGLAKQEIDSGVCDRKHRFDQRRSAVSAVLVKFRVIAYFAIVRQVFPSMKSYLMDDIFNFGSWINESSSLKTPRHR